MIWQKKDITQKFYPIVDDKMKSLRELWYQESQDEVSYKTFIDDASRWFCNSKRNDIQGWDSLPYIDVTMGCTHFIESFILKYGWNGFQILKDEYAYYTLMGKHGVDLADLEPNKPLIVTMPHWKFCDIRPEWDNLLKICEQRNIEIHIDMAWMTTAKEISVDLSHPCIKSIGMSLSKLNLQWSRIGLRFSRQKAMDSITIFNDYYHDTNTVLTSIGSYWIKNFERDYLWNTYEKKNLDLCNQLELRSTKLIHVAKDREGISLGIGNMLGQSAPNGI